ncbi:MlaA family lipoprotein [Comamonas endophytica]|uniref:VacJ family lipoprotein n=1 Tax=Comamonas endophytica TaxID=2949090 RepID=A0ABY6GC94_9BURK|nr:MULTISPECIES: VacJ family lipoprotein [unclassified Acidovorax]MCD2512951.1 VacJ family lipoprotein [Acidovorax sp. D4N7]UYG52707.1 VacJ family lipoprotein [Acidovorax sp. 5MLIR]
MNSSNPVGTSRAPLSVALVLTLALAGCATTADPQAVGDTATASTPNPADPFEPFNRSIYSFNTVLDDAVIKPVATVYRDVTPALAREGVGNFFSNLGDAWSFINNLAQGRGEGAYNSIVRFSVNTFLGIGGLLDIAGEMGVERRPQDFGLTLGRWGVPTGPYLVLPVLGPSTVRDTAALPVDFKGNPLSYSNDVAARNSLSVLGLVDRRARLLQAGEMLDAVALDKYSLTRDVYLQRRDQRAQGNGDLEADDFADFDADAGMLPPEE